ncbi:RES family NAD+ phosphorylase [Luteimonas sp. BDR2-5]|uniref:RES family NAD+ phosphorylase n=1 Tax=Proluteimonas luteida TaxID=2878685 RepID=UPI001E43B3EA|nr:RES family NAD+ phosphorylase [Luteimonas sp. BDR2-5]MCD9027240.1 RES family NAD+ phosphorylase [Luteimonas sp. BDR2-5]
MPPPVRAVAWRPSHRIVSSRFPPVGVFDAIADPQDMDALFELEGMTNPRLRQELGEISLVPPARRIAGPGTTPVMAAFTHPNRDGSRFADGRYGVYYAARERDTAIAETVHHRARFLAYTREPACVLELRCYLADIAGDFHDIRGGWPDLHDPASYAASQRAAAALREAGSDGIVYDSVRRSGGQCIAVFHPDRVAPARQGPHLHYHWDGSAIVRVTVAAEVIDVGAWPAAGRPGPR